MLHNKNCDNAERDDWNPSAIITVNLVCMTDTDPQVHPHLQIHIHRYTHIYTIHTTFCSLIFFIFTTYCESFSLLGADPLRLWDSVMNCLQGDSDLPSDQQSKSASRHFFLILPDCVSRLWYLLIYFTFLSFLVSLKFLYHVSFSYGFFLIINL